MPSEGNKFMPIHETNADYLRLYKKKFLCVDPTDLEIWGTYDSKKAKRLKIKLSRCEGKAYCKTDGEIDDFLNGKYLLLLKNQIRFDSEKQNQESLIRESRLDWIRVSSGQQSEQPYQLTQTRLQLQDYLIDLD